MGKKKYKKRNKKPIQKEDLVPQIKNQRTTISRKYLLEITFVVLTAGYILVELLRNLGYANFNNQSSIINYTWLILIGLSALMLIWVNRKELSNKSINVNNGSPQLNSLFSRLTRIPFLGRVASYFVTQGLWVNIGLLILLVLAGIIYIYNLGYYNWLPDEPLVMRTAKGYLESGTFYKWDYWSNTLSDEPYPRAWPHTWLVAQTINIFGSSEFSARMVSSVFGLLTIPILYFVSNFFLKNRVAAIVITACIVFHPFTVHYFRRVRMYAVLIPVFLLLFYYCYQALTSKKNYSFSLLQRWPALKQYLNYHWGYVIIALILLYFNYEIHKISLVILPAFFLFYLYLLVTRREKRLMLILLLALIPTAYLLFKENVWQSFSQTAGSNLDYNPLYWQFLFRYPISVGLSLIMLIASIVWVIFAEKKDEIISILSLVITGIILYIFVIEFNDHYRYVIHLIPFCLMISMGMMIKLNTLISNNILKSIIPVVIVLASVSEYNRQFEGVYYQNIEAQFPSQAYPTILNNIKPETEALFGLIFQDYYMSGMSEQIDFVEMEKNGRFTLDQFYKELRSYRAAWVTWPTRKSNHVNSEFYQHVAGNCVKYHGYGVDNTLTEVFYCRK